MARSLLRTDDRVSVRVPSGGPGTRSAEPADRSVRSRDRPPGGVGSADGRGGWRGWRGPGGRGRRHRGRGAAVDRARRPVRAGSLRKPAPARTRGPCDLRGAREGIDGVASGRAGRVARYVRGARGAPPRSIEHLTDLGVTAIELLPLQTFLDDQHVVERGLTNYWGYQPIAWHAPEPRYASRPDRADSELRAAVHALHEAGIEVILDVVYNHTGEGGSDGPTLSLRGFTPDYYRSAGGALIDDTGTGNTVAAENPMVLRLILDSLRHWATRYGIDGFRFDLASAVGRGADGFDAASAFFQAAGQDPVLSEVRLIAEPWDLGPGGYQLRRVPASWAEWNDAFRDDVRRAWRGDPLTLAALSARLLGSAHQFDHGDRSATSSVNFISAHDGFTLADVVSYDEKHNEANGEGNRDGHGENVSDGLGAEGPTSDPMILAARSRRAWAMLATLFVSQGTPMLLAGDELGNSQSGNNNAYAQDNPVGWVDWSSSVHRDFVRQMIELRRRTPILRQGAFLHSELRADGDVDVTWLRADGSVIDEADWQDPQFRTLVAVLRGAAVDPVGESLTGAVAVILNPGPEAEVRLPSGEWEVEVDSVGRRRAVG